MLNAVLVPQGVPWGKGPETHSGRAGLLKVPRVVPPRRILVSVRFLRRGQWVMITVRLQLGQGMYIGDRLGGGA